MARSTTPQAAPIHALKPVRGSELAPACALVAAGDVADVAEGKAELAVAPDDALGEAAGVDEPDPDPLEGLLFEVPFEPPSGSLYCWSPADGPVARAEGASSIRAARAIRR